MASGIVRTDDMAYVGETPWHGLGIKVAGLMTAQDVAEACPRFVAPVLKLPAEFDGKPVPGHYFTVRSDDRTVLGHVGAEYSVAQNRELLDLTERLCMDPNGPRFETVGLLWEGRRSWILARFPEDMVLRGKNGTEDIIGQYLLVSNSHDGSQSLRIQATPIRVVCQNTLNMAYRGKDANSSAFITHSGDIHAKFANVGELLGIAMREFHATAELYQALIDVKPTKAQVDNVMEKLFPETKSNRSELQRDRVLQLAESGIGNAPFRGTAWALYQGYTELQDHIEGAGSRRPDADSMRLNRAWFGTGAEAKSRALATIAREVL